MAGAQEREHINDSVQSPGFVFLTSTLRENPWAIFYTVRPPRPSLVTQKQRTFARQGSKYFSGPG